MSKKILAFVLCVGAVLPCAYAEDGGPLTVETTVGVYTDYMWRGFNLYDDMSLQPSIDVSYDTGSIGTLGVNGWMHISMDQDEEQNEFTEYDLTPYWEMSFDKLTVSAGFLFYFYPNEDEENIPDTSEVFASISYDTLLSPTLKFYHDYDEFNYQYYELGLSHTFEIAELGEGFNLTPSIAIGFADSAEDVYADDSGLVQITYGISMEAPLGNMTVTPGVYYTQEDDDALEDEWWGGFSLAYSFN